jgi:predicted Zn finger-like uncharacterized protein
MIVQCENCLTKFNLDDSQLSEEGAWVRCSNCKDVFQVMPAPEGAEAGPEDDVDLDLGEFGEGEAGLEKEAGIDLEAGLDLSQKPEGGMGGFAKALFWLVGCLIVLAMAFAGGLVAMDRMGVGTETVDKFRSLPLLQRLLRPTAPDGRQVGETTDIMMALAEVRGYFRANQKVGRIFVIHGVVKNSHPEVRTEVLVRGRLHGSKGKIVRQAVVYAGPMFAAEELTQFSLEEIQARLGRPVGPDGSKYVVTSQGTIPFMIVFANLPTNLREFTAEVVISKPLGAPAPAKQP